jgi:hypothetical protein
MGMPNQYFVEKSESLDHWSKPRLAACCFERRSVDDAHIVPEGIMDCHNCIKWFCHFLFLLLFFVGW